MEPKDMGRVTEEILVENMSDLCLVQAGHLTVEQVRRIVIPDALADTGATLLSLPASVVRQLGLPEISRKRVVASSGLTDARLCGPVRLTIQGRFCTMDVLEVPDGVPALIGQLPLEHLDFVVDLRNRKLIGNPAHNGEHVYEMY